MTITSILNDTDDDGYPSGGYVHGVGLDIGWQAGPVKSNGVNGAQCEEVIAAVIQRLDWLNTASNRRFSCRENSLAITKLEEALHWLNARTARREAEGTEGTHSGS